MSSPLGMQQISTSCGQMQRRSDPVLCPRTDWQTTDYRDTPGNGSGYGWKWGWMSVRAVQTVEAAQLTARLLSMAQLSAMSIE
jgi:hypothetical protein